MKIEELREKAKDELQKLLREDRDQLRQMRFDLAAGKVKNLKGIRGKRKEIARILTIMKHEK